MSSRKSSTKVSKKRVESLNASKCERGCKTKSGRSSLGFNSVQTCLSHHILFHCDDLIARKLLKHVYVHFDEIDAEESESEIESESEEEVVVPKKSAGGKRVVQKSVENGEVVVEKPKARSKAAKKKAVMEETEVDEEGEVISEDLAGMRV